MSVLFPALVVALIAFCIWLTVRLVNRGERWAKCIAVLLVFTPPIYILGVGPVCWWVVEPQQTHGGTWFAIENGTVRFENVSWVITVPGFYWPLGRAARRFPTVHRALGWYVHAGTSEGTAVFIPVRPEKQQTIRL